MFRTRNCGELTEKNLNEEVKIAGWLSSVRDLGYIIFAVIRDFYGITQVAISGEEDKKFIRSLRKETVISVDGKVVLRSSPNKEIFTGLIEIVPSKIEILGNCSEELPFEIDISHENREDTRLKYRFLDLRNDLNKQKIVKRSKFLKAIRDIMYDLGFLEFQTPILTSSSPEGARDYLVPSRLYEGQFYALPQAPQQFKQLLMISGFDKYFQIAPCFRDEDARADRSPGEFYQLDIEMAFAHQEDVFSLMENVLPKLFSDFSSKKIASVPFPRIKYFDAIEKYGSDKPDLRNPLTLTDAAEIVKLLNVEFLNRKQVKAVIVKNCEASRKEIDAILADFKTDDVALSWLKIDREGNFAGALSKFFDSDEKKNMLLQTGAKSGDLVFFVANNASEFKTFGLVRTAIAERFNLIEKDIFKFCWIVDFPMYEYNEEEGKIDFCHNPFSMPQGGMKALKEKDPLEILAFQYDIVCNGIELSSGAVRNHEVEIMIEAFKLAGYGQDVLESKFGALFSAFKFGAPPHAGIAPGVDRMLMLLSDEPNIREIIAFPMNKNARDLLMNAPNFVSEKQLKEIRYKNFAKGTLEKSD